MRFLLILILLTQSQFILSQTYNAIWENQNTQVYHYVEVDAATGAKTDLQPIVGLLGPIVPGNFVLKTSTNEYIFRGTTGGSNKLYRLDAATGVVQSNPNLDELIVGMEYDCETDTIYAIWEDSQQLYHLIWLDPVTASFGSLGSLPGVVGYVGGSFALDAESGRYHFAAAVGQDIRLYSIDVHTGNVVADPLFPDNVHGWAWSCESDTIYARWEDQMTGNYYLVWIDPTTGNYAPVGQMNGYISGFVMEAFAVDASAGLYTFLGYPSSGPIELISIDVSTATASYSNPVSFTNMVGFRAANCCADTTTPPPAPPVASFTSNYSDTICTGDSVVFTSNSTGDTTLTWNFIGGTCVAPCSGSSVTVVYDSIGAWDVSLSVAGPQGTDDTTATGYIVVAACDTSVIPAPLAAFTSNYTDTICMGDTVQFSSTSTNSTSLEWTFNGGTCLDPDCDSSSVLVVFETPGSWNVSLMATGQGGTDDTTAANFVVVQDCTPDTTGISEMWQRNVRLFPNPSTSSAVVSWPSESAITSIDVFDSSGRIVQRISTSQSKQNIVIQDIKAGYYILKLNSSTHTSTTLRWIVLE